MTRFSRRLVERVYREHPQRKAAILERVIARRGSLAGVTEQDLAEDPTTELTDQNHVGGLAFNHELAILARVEGQCSVLDLCCGLGGPARWLAWRYGCQVHGLDLSPERICEACELTTLVGLDRLVSFECGDVLTAPLPERRFDILWGQSAWNHIETKHELVRRWSSVLTAKGRVALEDTFLRRPAQNEQEFALVNELEDHTTSYLTGLDGPTGWRSVFEQAGLVIDRMVECTVEYERHFLDLQRAAGQPAAARATEFERESWRLAIKGVDAGLVGYFRILAARAAV